MEEVEKVEEEVVFDNLHYTGAVLYEALSYSGMRP